MFANGFRNQNKQSLSKTIAICISCLSICTNSCKIILKVFPHKKEILTVLEVANFVEVYKYFESNFLYRPNFFNDKLNVSSHIPIFFLITGIFYANVLKLLNFYFSKMTRLLILTKK